MAKREGYLCWDDYFMSVALLSGKRSKDLVTHIAETQDEVRIVREKYGMTPVEHLDALGMLDARTIGAPNKFIITYILLCVIA